MKLKYLYIWLIGLLAIGCFDDDTKVDTVRLSEISIDTTKLQKVYNLDKNEVLVIDITQYVTQSGKEFPLSVQWDMDYDFYSDEAILNLDCRQLGEFPMRVKVSNDHGSAFYEFTINVNSPYEEGIMVLSSDASGNGMLSFMRQLKDEQAGTGTFESSCLTINNPGETFPKNPTDISKRLAQIFISYKNEPSIYVVNAKTFEIENIVTAPEYSSFKPDVIMLPDNAARTAIAITESGVIYNLASLEGMILPHTVFKSTYSHIQHGYFSGYNPYYYIWDTAVKSLVCFNGYTADYFTTFGEVWPGGHDIVAIFDDVKGSSFTVLTSLNGEIWKTSLSNTIYLLNSSYQQIGIDFRDAQRVIDNPVLTADDPKVASSGFQSLFYAKGDKIYRWFYTATSFPTDVWKTISDVSGAEITALGVSNDESQLYVGVYEPGATGLNGHIYIYDIRTGNLVKAHKNVAYKPIKIKYKIK